MTRLIRNINKNPGLSEQTVAKCPKFASPAYPHDPQETGPEPGTMLPDSHQYGLLENFTPQPDTGHCAVLVQKNSTDGPSKLTTILLPVYCKALQGHTDPGTI